MSAFQYKHVVYKRLEAEQLGWGSFKTTVNQGKWDSRATWLGLKLLAAVRSETLRLDLWSVKAQISSHKSESSTTLCWLKQLKI